ncbi:hypothetical protein MMB232_01850 [Brevundimonas subvibrioides]|uniref:hypothetical protein n=1 Tax=Brevundimonas subvibrioides TaxID=74313 RepID=UPI0032D5884F
MNAHRAKKIVGLALASVSTAGVAGCAGAFDPTTDATSPIAPRVQALVDANREYPRWADFPKTATDTPRPIEVAARVNTLRASGGALAGEASRIEWTLGDPVAFANEVNARVDAQAISPVTAETQAEVDAFAAELRRRGTAPPPIDRTPAPR